MLALLTVPAVMSMVLATTEGSENAADTSYTDAIGLPVWAYTVAGAIIFLGLLAITFGFRSTGKRH